MRSDIPDIMHAKYELLNRAGILRYEHDTAAFSDVEGWSILRPGWNDAASLSTARPPTSIHRRGSCFSACGLRQEPGGARPAAVFGAPLLSLDCAALFDKFVGETERNLRESLQSAELLAPCVLWIDEIEKAFGIGGEADNGTARRVLGSFLTWLSEKHARVFVLATANDISCLPPELVRKGRFDEIFFVDLPDARVPRKSSPSICASVASP